MEPIRSVTTSLYTYIHTVDKPETTELLLPIIFFGAEVLKLDSESLFPHYERQQK